MNIIFLILCGMLLGLLIGIAISLIRSGGYIHTYSVGAREAERISSESTRGFSMFEDDE